MFPPKRSALFRKFAVPALRALLDPERKAQLLIKCIAEPYQLFMILIRLGDLAFQIPDLPIEKFELSGLPQRLATIRFC